MSKPGLEPAQHETADVSGAFIWVGAATVTLAVVFLATLVVWLFPGSLIDRTLHLPLSPYPAPALQTDPAADMAHFYSQEMAQLDSSGWIDQNKGHAHVPIAQAMRLVAKEGIPGWPGAPDQPPFANPAEPDVQASGVATSKPQEKLHEAHRHDRGARRPGAGRRCPVGARRGRCRL